jgi:pentatricopeptide repeat protein
MSQMTTNHDMISSSPTSFTSVMALALGSMVNELVALVIFFATWLVVSYMRKKPPQQNPLKGQQSKKRAQSTPEIAEVIVNLCHEQFTRALRLYRDLVKSGRDKEIHDEAFYTALVESSIRVGKADVAEQVIVRMHENGMVPSVQFLQSLLKLFAARKNFAECLRAWELFEPKPDQVIYSCLTLAAAETSNAALCREFLARSAANFELSGRDVLPLLRLHARKRDHAGAAEDLRDIFRKGWEVEAIVLNTVLAVCVHAPDMEVMEDLVRETKEYEQKRGVAVLDIVSYNTLIKSAARRGDVHKGFELLDMIQAAKLEADDVTFSTLLDVCIDREEHELASQALDRMCDSGVKMNCVLLTTLMKGFIRSHHLDKAMALFDTMRSAESQVKPDMITYSMLIKAQCDAGDMGKALQILEDMLQNQCDVDDVVFTHLIEGCCQVSNLGLAEKLFKDMLSAQISPSVYTLTAMVKVYGKCGQSERAWELVQSMPDRFHLQPTVIMYTCLISCQIRHKKHADAYAAFKWMCERCQPDAQCVTTVLGGLCEGRMWAEVLELVTEALRRRPPLKLKEEALNSALSALINSGELSMARLLASRLSASGIEVSAAVRKRMEA